MNILAYVTNQIALYRKRRQLKSIDHFIWQLEDQVESGVRSLKYWRDRRNQVEAEMFAIEPPDEIVRRGAQA